MILYVQLILCTSLLLALTMRNLHTTIRENKCGNRGCIGSHSYCMYTVATNTVEHCPVESYTLHLCSCQFLISLKLESDRVVGWEVHGVDNGHCSPQLVQGITNHLLTQAHTSLHLVLHARRRNKRIISKSHNIISELFIVYLLLMCFASFN